MSASSHVATAAKIDEGDERWIVQEREDGRNVGGWHWEERDMSKWATSHYEELATGAVLLDGSGGMEATVTKVKSFTGEVTVTHRRGKTYLFYEVAVTLSFKATLNAGTPGEVVAKGTVDMPYIAEENARDGDYEINVKLTKNNSAAAPLLAAIKAKVRPVVVDLFVRLLDDLREHAKPTGAKKASGAGASKAPPASGAAQVAMETEPAAAAAPAAAAPAKTKGTGSTKSGEKTDSFKQKLHFDLPPEEVFAWITDEGRLSAVTQAATSMPLEAGAAFTMFSGLVSGTNVAIEAPTKLVQDWRFESWPAGHHSRVEFTLTPSRSGGTDLTLSQSGIPRSDFERTKTGWSSNLFNRFKALTGLSVDFL
ncbi:uncharacterized protein AMSG_12213 [Thecamonas trahens ATCC 50062]|uniref:Activator of Hsp90 ATPase AHSA1-like N-terminal domain-containing protein n=1 Tax=Thecamonas trahens ATCC 50062 TaxID=461836 RepID=A0A0L0DPN7_THETB|nr:hypothetical protein AMSG_12213 [Thecamonas trahens ATCC 50062]KNC53393.1 hypothetical protein AMSG_12213 [Thecamonas trahens ATCC 50062]|eukprot:XP_013754489.1 hypothetical protein AMSG_12213 [Thecamonas trahens ATCC 50062]